MWNKTVCSNNSLCFAVLSIFHHALEMKLRHLRTPGRSRGKSGLSGTVASGRRLKWKLLWLQQVGTSRQKRKLAISLVCLHQHNLQNLPHLIAFPFLATNGPNLYFHHLTHIENCLLVGAAPETRSKPLIQLQIAGWKAVTSALGCSIPQQRIISELGRHTFFFITFCISFVMWPAHSVASPSTALQNWLFDWTRTLQPKHNIGKK